MDLTPRGRVLLVEDEDILRSSLCTFLQKSGFDVAEAEDEAGALKHLKDNNFSLVITDLFLSDGNGFEIMKFIQENRQEAKCIVITGHASLDSAIKAIRKGAFDYLLKPFEYAELKAAVERVFEKQADEKIIRKIDFQKVAKTYSLTKKELQITKIVVSEGLSNAELSERLKISKNTVKVHLRNIFKKIGVESKTALATLLISK